MHLRRDETVASMTHFLRFSMLIRSGSCLLAARPHIAKIAVTRPDREVEAML